MGAITLIQAFELLYTRFILRDFIGKIVPGSIFIGITLLSKYDFGEIRNYMNHLTYLETAAFASIAWLFALSSQSVQSRISHFYFPHQEKNESLWQLFFNFFEREDIYRAEVVEVYHFFAEATPDEKAQYERYVVIKEACANSLFCTCLGIVIFTINVTKNYFMNSNIHSFGDISIRVFNFMEFNCAEILALCFWLVAAYLMKKDNLHRQTAFLVGSVRRREKKKRDFFDYKNEQKIFDFLYWLIKWR